VSTAMPRILFMRSPSKDEGPQRAAPERRTKDAAADSSV
jgi:hypothetical protein